MRGATNSTTPIKPVTVTGYEVDPSVTFNTTFSSITRSGNVVVISMGGCNFSYTGSRVWNLLTKIPKAVNRALAPIYEDTTNNTVGYVMVDGTTLKYATVSAVTAGRGVGQITYITDEGGGA